MPILPPYGVFTRELRALALARIPLPDWRKHLPEADRLTQWGEWFDETLGILNRTLWPQWSYQHRMWDTSGGITVDQAIALTEADFELMHEFGLTEGSNVPKALDEVPASELKTAVCGSHLLFFQEEDGRPGRRRDQDGVGLSYADYDRDADWFEEGNVKALYEEGLIRKDINGNLKASVGLPFKYHLQRPRPNQMAVILGKEKFLREKAQTALHPSMISGHCLQGLMAVGHIFHRLLDYRIPISGPSQRVLRQFMADVGDRRVFAGVHYPSDNLSSFILAMRLVYDSFPAAVAPLVHREMWLAITEHSRVYRLMKDSNNPAYAAGLAELDAHQPKGLPLQPLEATPEPAPVPSPS